MSEQLQKELENLKKENDALKGQVAQNKQEHDASLAQLQAHGGELADSRTICMQLRINLVHCQKHNVALNEANQNLQNQLNVANAKLKDLEVNKVPEAPLKEVAKGK